MFTLSDRHLLRVSASFLFFTVLLLPGPLSRLDGQSSSVSSSAARWLNHDPSISYVGSEACTPCHREYSDAFREHGMARSFRPMSPQIELADWSGTQVVVDQGSDYRYQPTKRDGRYFIREFRLNPKQNVTHELSREVHYAIGSGTNDRGYLHEHQGYLYMMPLEWYRQLGAWDFAPAFEVENRRFSRFVTPRCIGCHNAYPQPLSLAGGRFEPPFPQGISCERCHGPGGLHVQTRLTEAVQQPGSVDPTIVNPAHLSPSRQLDVCAQCHMLGDAEVLHPGREEFDFRPGERLSDHRAVFVTKEPSTPHLGFVRHLERLVRSPCFIGSMEGKSSVKMTCTTCHNPHASSTNLTPAYWTQKCLQCHRVEHCSREHREKSSTSEAENCVGCHMSVSPLVDLRHVLIHDHWIRRLIEPPTRQVIQRYSPGPDAELVPFPWPDGAEESLELRALAYADLQIMDRARKTLLDAAGARSAPTTPQPGDPVLRASVDRLHDPRSQILAARLLWGAGDQSSALALLNEVLAATPGSVPAMGLRTALLADVGAGPEALADARRVAALDPYDPIALMTLARAETAHGSQTGALSAYTTVLKLLPYSAEAMLGLGELSLSTGDARAAQQLYRRAVEEIPLDPRAHFGLGFALTRLGATHSAELAYRRTIALDPDFAQAQYNLGNLLVSSDPAAAESAYRAALRAQPNYAEAHGNLAFLLLQRGDKRGAIRAFRHVLALRPKDPTALRMLQQLNAIP